MKRKAKARRPKTGRKARPKRAGRSPAVGARKTRRPAGRKRRAKGPKPQLPRLGPEAQDRGEMVGLLEDRLEHKETGPALSGGDVDADWQRAWSSGDEAVGGSVATPDQDVVDEIGHAMGVDQPSDAPVRPAEDILRERDRFYWHLERRGSPPKRER